MDAAIGEEYDQGSYHNTTSQQGRCQLQPPADLAMTSDRGPHIIISFLKSGGSHDGPESYKGLYSLHLQPYYLHPETDCTGVGDCRILFFLFANQGSRKVTFGIRPGGEGTIIPCFPAPENSVAWDLRRSDDEDLHKRDICIDFLVQHMGFCIGFCYMQPIYENIVVVFRLVMSLHWGVNVRSYFYVIARIGW